MRKRKDTRCTADSRAPAAVRLAIPLLLTTARADEHLAPVFRAEKQSGIFQDVAPAGRTGRSRRLGCTWHEPYTRQSVPRSGPHSLVSRREPFFLPRFAVQTVGTGTYHRVEPCRGFLLSPAQRIARCRLGARSHRESGSPATLPSWNLCYTSDSQRPSMQV